MTMSTGTDIVGDIIKIIFTSGTVLALGYVIWTLFNRRIDMIESAHAKHVEDCIEVRREQRDTLNTMNARSGDNAVLLAEMSASFKSLHESINRIASHLESERGTRARADDRLEQIWIGEVRSLRHSLIKYGRRNSDPPESCPPT